MDIYEISIYFDKLANCVQSMKYLLLSLFFFLFFSYSDAIAQDTILLQDNLKQVSGNDKEGYFVTKKVLPIQQVLRETFKVRDSVDLNYITAWVWVKFVIKNNSNNNRFVLYTTSGHISGLYMYKPNLSGHGYTMTPPKKYSPEDGRELFNRLPAFFLELKKGETKTFYLKIDTQNELVKLTFVIRDYEHYVEYVQADYIILGLYYGALSLIFIVNIFYFISLKDSIFLVYAIYAYGTFQFAATMDGFTWLLFSDTNTAYHVSYFCIRFWTDALLFFTIQLVNLQQRHKVAITIAYAFILYHSIIMAVLEYMNVFNMRLNFMSQWETINCTIGIITVFIIIILSYKENKYLFKYYVIAFGALLIVIVLLPLYGFGGAENHLIVQHGLKVGMFCEMLTLSFAVSRRFKMTEMDLKLKKEEKQHLNNKVTQLEMDVRKAQMNPHFMFNALTSIEYFIFKNDTTQARAYLNKFAQLMRLTLDHSRSNFVSLQDELRSLRFYIELEFLRMKTHLHNFEIKIDEGIDCDAVLVPPLIIQPFVENAIWHGLQKVDRDGNLRIHIRFINDELFCTVEDDGIGINAIPAQKKNHKSSGVLITQERLSLIHSILNTSCTFNIENIKKETSPESSGTRVQFTMPYHL
jgi:sensor histidine kinase YesM